MSKESLSSRTFPGRTGRNTPSPACPSAAGHFRRTEGKKRRNRNARSPRTGAPSERYSGRLEPRLPGAQRTLAVYDGYNRGGRAPAQRMRRLNFRIRHGNQQPPPRRMRSMNSMASHHGAGSRVPDTLELPSGSPEQSPRRCSSADIDPFPCKAAPSPRPPYVVGGLEQRPRAQNAPPPISVPRESTQKHPCALDTPCLVLQMLFPGWKHPRALDAPFPAGAMQADAPVQYARRSPPFVV